MSDNETQTFETTNGHATQADDDDREELSLPPALADALDRLSDTGKKLRKTWKPTSEEGKTLKRWFTNYFMEELEQLFAVFAGAFTETYQFAAMVNANQMQFREQMLAALAQGGMATGAPLLDGTVSVEQIATVRRALAQHGLMLAEKYADDEELNEGFSRVIVAFTSLLGQDLLPVGPDAAADLTDLEDDDGDDYDGDGSESDSEAEDTSQDGEPE